MHQPRGQSLRSLSIPLVSTEKPDPLGSLPRGEFSPLSITSSSSSTFSSPSLLPLSLHPRPLPPPQSPRNTARLVSLAELPPPFGLPTVRTLSRLETSLIGRTRGWKKRRYPRIRPITVNARDNARDILHPVKPGEKNAVLAEEASASARELTLSSEAISLEIARIRVD